MVTISMLTLLMCHFIIHLLDQPYCWLLYFITFLFLQKWIFKQNIHLVMVSKQKRNGTYGHLELCFTQCMRQLACIACDIYMYIVGTCNNYSMCDSTTSNINYIRLVKIVRYINWWSRINTGSIISIIIRLV